MTVSVVIDPDIAFGTVQLRRHKTAEEGGGYERVSFATSGNVLNTSFVIDGTSRKFGTYDVSSSSTTEDGAVKSIQVEAGAKATPYEAYKAPEDGVRAISPTTTIIANDPTTEITATYNKDVGLVVQDLERKIATLETALANS